MIKVQICEGTEAVFYISFFGGGVVEIKWCHKNMKIKEQVQLEEE